MSDKNKSCETSHCHSNLPVIGLVISLLILGLGIAHAGTSILEGLKNFRSYDRSVTMKGLAQRDVTADLAIWPISYTETGNDLVALQNLMEKRGQDIIAFLKEHGIKDEEIELQQVQVQDLLAQSYRQNNVGDNRYILTQTYLARTNDIENLEKASKNIGTLIKKGVVFSSNSTSTPTYLYTKLNDIKPDMLAEATRNARDAAKEFAKNSGQEVGEIKDASQGVFQILPRDDTYMIPESQQKYKTVRIVSTISFYLED
jgi:hypothetical protein